MNILTPEISKLILCVLTEYETGVTIDENIKRDIFNIKKYINSDIVDLSDEVEIHDEFED